MHRSLNARLFSLLVMTTVTYGAIAADLVGDRAVRSLGDRSQTANEETFSQQHLEELRSQANNGLSEAQLVYGALLLDGRHVQKNFIEGFRLITQAAEAGNVRANTVLGTLYQKGGDNYRQNSQKAEYYLATAASKGDAEAQYRLWVLYSFDPQKRKLRNAKEMLEQSARQRHPAAMSDLGRNIIYGEYGFDVNVPRGTELVSSAAEMGESRAMYVLAFLYAGGKNSPFTKNNVNALAWARLSQSFSTTTEIAAKGATFQRLVEKEMSAQEIEKAEILADRLMRRLQLNKDSNSFSH